MLLVYVVLAFCCLVVFSFLAGVTGEKEEWDNAPGGAPIAIPLCLAAAVWPLTLLCFLVYGVCKFGEWVRARLKEELKGAD